MLDQNLKAFNADNQFKKFKYQQKKSLQTQYSNSFFTLYTDCAILFAVREEGLIKAFALYSQPKLIKALILMDFQQSYFSQPILTFMEKSKYLAFVNKCNQIVICELNQTFQFTTCQEFQAHSKEILNLQTNESQDLLVSGSIDKQIKIWKKDNLSWGHLYTIDAEMGLFQSLSLNDSGTKLIVCDSVRKIINIFELQPNFQWDLNQIQLCDDGEQIYFINDNQFIVQSWPENEYLEIYNYDEQTKLYNRSESLGLSYDQNSREGGDSFPPQFIKEKNILIVKLCGYLDFFGIDQEGNYIKQQTNQFNTSPVDCKVNNNGRFLFTMVLQYGKFYLSTYQTLE